jgi:ABC-2 type transport system ATP-binding protein
MLTEADLQGVASVTSVQPGAECWLLGAVEPHVALPAVLARVGERGATLTRLTTRHATLEDVFVSLTGRQLRDG